MARTLLALAVVIAACTPSAAPEDGGTGGGTGGGAAGGGGGTTSDAGVTVDWFSDWRGAIGTTQPTLYDGTKWSGQLCNAPVLEVIPATGLDFPTANVLRVSYEQPGQCLMVEAINRWRTAAVGEYLFVRVYYRNAIPDGAVVGFPHPIHIGRTADPNYAYATWFNFIAPSGGRSSLVLQLGGGPVWPDRDWQLPVDTQRTHRLEVRMHRLTATTATTDVRVYGSAGTLIAESDDWTNGEGGANLRVLATVRPTFSVTDDSFRLLQLGNNDPSGLVSGTGRYLYLGAAAVVVSSDPNAWPGAYPTPGESP